MNALSYHILEMSRLALSPAIICSDLARMTFGNPVNPLAYSRIGRNLAASAELFGRLTRRYGKPAFGLDTTVVDGQEVSIVEEIVWRRPFCNLLHFKRDSVATAKPQPRLLIVAPMSGHYATLLRGTVEAFLPTHDVMITDWTDARLVPQAAGRFDLDDYIDYVIEMCEFLSEADGSPFHVLAVCQPSVPVLAAVARMEAEGNRHIPASMTLIGGPIDTRRGRTGVNKFAEKHGLDWFRQHCIHAVPFPYPGMGRAVYPGFQQLSGFLAMNFDRHIAAHVKMFNHLVEGDGEAAEKHRRFYDEYLAVMDLSADFFLQTIDTVFLRHALPRGEMMHRDRKVDPAAIRRVGLMTIEGGKDDISGIGQTRSAQRLCANIPESLRAHHLQGDVGHYGMFNGSRFRSEIAPRICDFHARVEQTGKDAQRARVPKLRTISRRIGDGRNGSTSRAAAKPVSLRNARRAVMRQGAIVETISKSEARTRRPREA